MQVILFMLWFVIWGIFFAFGFNFWRSRTSKTQAFAAHKSTDKVRVKLLVDINSIGKKGEIIQISRNQWLNVLQPKKMAQQVSDVQLAKIEQNAQEVAVKKDLESRELLSRIMAIQTIRLPRKAGPNMQLFGTVTAKSILDEIKQRLPSNLAKAFAQKPILIKEISETVSSRGRNKVDGVETAGSTKLEIRRLGHYDIKIHVSDGQLAVVKLEIVAE